MAQKRQTRPKPKSRRAPRREETSIEVSCPRCKQQHTITVTDVTEVEAYCTRSGHGYRVAADVVRAKVAAARRLPADPDGAA